MTKEHIPYFQILAFHNAEWLIVLLTNKKNVCAFFKCLFNLLTGGCSQVKNLPHRIPTFWNYKMLEPIGSLWILGTDIQVTCNFLQLFFIWKLVAARFFFLFGVWIHNVKVLLIKEKHTNVKHNHRFIAFESYAVTLRSIPKNKLTHLYTQISFIYTIFPSLSANSLPALLIWLNS